MPYCNWCQMESETDDVCAWCKRPYQRNVAYGNVYDGVAMLREEGADVGDRATLVIGGLVAAAFLAVVVYALVAFSGPKSTSSDPLNQIAASETTWTGESPAPQPAAAAPTYVGSAPSRPAPSVAPATAPSKPKPQRGSPPASSVASVNAVPQGFAARDGEVIVKGLYIERASLGAKPDKEGRYTVNGTIGITNASGHRASELSFWLVVDQRRVRLTPKGSRDVGSGMTVDFSVEAKGVDPEIAKAKEAAVHIVAKTEAGEASDSLMVGG